MTSENFAACEVCGANRWEIVYRGNVRRGAFGKLSEREAIVGSCGVCGIERLAEPFCCDSTIYESSEYRNLLEEGWDADSFFVQHDSLQHQNISAVQPESLRNRTIVDVGCAAGSFLDHVSGLVNKAIAIEPCDVYHPSLKQRGYCVFSDISAARSAYEESADFAFCFSVIEHVENPREFLAAISGLLATNGKLLVSTPNRLDVLMRLLPDDYPSFFYRSVHRWYFDKKSFEYCANLAGLKVLEAKCNHRFGLSNALIWLRDRKPAGRKELRCVSDKMINQVWQSHLEREGSGDYLYFWLGRSG